MDGLLTMSDTILQSNKIGLFQRFPMYCPHVKHQRACGSFRDLAGMQVIAQ